MSRFFACGLVGITALWLAFNPARAETKAEADAAWRAATLTFRACLARAPRADDCWREHAQVDVAFARLLEAER